LRATPWRRPLRPALAIKMMNATHIVRTEMIASAVNLDGNIIGNCNAGEELH
jgi:hypothetical protein